MPPTAAAVANHAAAANTTLQWCARSVVIEPVSHYDRAVASGPALNHHPGSPPMRNGLREHILSPDGRTHAPERRKLMNPETVRGLTRTQQACLIAGPALLIVARILI